MTSGGASSEVRTHHKSRTLPRLFRKMTIRSFSLSGLGHTRLAHGPGKLGLSKPGADSCFLCGERRRRYNVGEWRGCMCVFRILFFVLLMSVCVSAQPSPDQNSVSPEFEIHGLVAPLELRADQALTPFQDGQNLMGVDPSEGFFQRSPLQGSSSLPPEPEQRCYSIRTYRVTRDDPQSDTITPAGYSECETASSFHIAVVGSPGKP
jgi:hypothetical protein